MPYKLLEMVLLVRNPSLQQRRKRLEYEKREVTNAATYPQGKIKKLKNESSE